MLKTRELMYVLLLIIWCVLPVQGFEVVEEELRFEDPPIIEFENYIGPRTTISTAEEIIGIGRFLGAARDQQLTELQYGNRYRIIRAVDRDALVGLHADILFILPDAQVDHIDNIRRILSGYLSETYGYSSNDARLLARFITVYNAVHHRNLDFYASRYTPYVITYLSDTGAGLPLSYRQWPGNSELVVPIRDPDAVGRLGILSPTELIDPAVMEDLRSRRDMGLEERRDMVDFLERLIDEESEVIETERAEITAEREDIDVERAAIAEEREELEESDDPDPERISQLDEQESRIEEQEREVDDREEELSEREEQTEQIREELDRLREDIVDDREQQIEDDPQEEIISTVGLPDLFPMLLVTDSNPIIRSQLVLVEKNSGRIAGRSTASNIIGRDFLLGSHGIIALSGTQNAAFLSSFDRESLQIVLQSEQEVYPFASLVMSGNVIYTVIIDGNTAHIGRFNQDLELTERSLERVLPHTAIAFEDNLLYVQTADNRIIALSAESLEIIE